MVSWPIPLILPSALAASRIRCDVFDRRTVASNTCWRIITALTGRPRRFAAIAAATLSGAMPSFDPNPPPMKREMIRTLSSATPSDLASCCASEVGIWYAPYSVSAPSASHVAIEACGSIAAEFWLGVV